MEYPKEIDCAPLILKGLEEDCYKKMIELLTSEEVKKTYMVPSLSTLEEKRALFSRLMERSNNRHYLFYGIYLDCELIGFIHEVEKKEEEIEIGYVISPRAKGRGYATLAFSTIIPMLFDCGFKRILAGAFEENQASQKVMLKCGLVKTMKNEVIPYNGSEYLCLYYEIDKERG